MADLRSVRVKIDRAKKHLADLDVAIRAFEALGPYKVVTDEDSESGYEIYQFRMVHAIPSEWSAILGDCVHNLRSALDHLAVELVLAGGGTPTDWTHFPIGSDVSYFNSKAIRRINGAPADAIELVRKLKPYGGGNETLWRLHRIDIADKHKLLIPVAAIHKVTGIQWNIVGPGFEHITGFRVPAGPRRKFPLVDGDELGARRHIVAQGFQDKTKIEFEFEIAFGEGQIFDGEAVIPTLAKLINFAERLIDIFAKRNLKMAIW